MKIKDGVTELDMAGCLSGENNVSGAIPPIGTSSYPFEGEFNGNGAVIKNLWVSTDENDWYEKPSTIDGSAFSVGTDIGLFGKIVRGANVSNFYLENIEVTNTLGGVNLGIIAGYVDGNISEIGVKNAKLTLETGTGAAISSAYSLIGYKTSNVIWEDLPSDSTDGGSGGDLIINPTFDKKAHETNGTTNKIDIPGSVSGTAYYVGSLSVITPKPKPTAAFLYNDSTITFGDPATESKKTYIANTSTATPIDLNNPGTIESEFVSMMKTTGDIHAIIPGTSNKNNNKVDVALPNFNAVTAMGKYPTNSVWFKPIAAGNCSIAFSRQNNSADETMSIYRYLRNTDGTIKDGSLQEIILNFTANNSLGNGSVVYFNLSVTKEDLAAGSDDNTVLNGYEYVIGVSSTYGSSSGGTACFVFLKLAGTDTQGGLGTAPDGNTYRMLKNIDFVATIGTAADLANLKMYRSILEISGTQSGDGAIYYGASESESERKVIYANNAAVSVTQKLTTKVEAAAVAYSATTFPPRQETTPQAN